MCNLFINKLSLLLQINKKYSEYDRDKGLILSDSWGLFVKAIPRVYINLCFV